MTVEEIIDVLKLQPHPVEGGFFRETYRSVEILPKDVLPHNPGPRFLPHCHLLFAHSEYGIGTASVADR